MPKIYLCVLQLTKSDGASLVNAAFVVAHSQQEALGEAILDIPKDCMLAQQTVQAVATEVCPFNSDYDTWTDENVICFKTSSVRANPELTNDLLAIARKHQLLNLARFLEK